MEILNRIKWLIEESKKADLRAIEIEGLLKTQLSDKERFDLEYEYENLGVIRVVVCKQCNSYRSDLEWRRKKIMNCLKCGEKRVTHPPIIPAKIKLILLIRFLVKGY